MSNNTITKEQIESIISKVDYQIMGEKTTICVLTLNNGFEVVGQSACVDPANFDQALGEKYAYDNAFEKVWELEGYALQQQLYSVEKADDVQTERWWYVPRTSMEQARNMINMQGMDGTWNYDGYFHGMYNGMELILSTIECRSPIFREAPEGGFINEPTVADESLEHYEALRGVTETARGKSLHNTDVNGARKNVKDIVVFGNGDMFQLLCKASSENEGWMKSTKAMEIPGAGCVVQVTTQQRNPDGSYSLDDAVTFVPQVQIKETRNADGVVVGRELVSTPLCFGEHPVMPNRMTQED